jgi:hypothetical protein
LPWLHPAFAEGSGGGDGNFADRLERLQQDVEQLTGPEILVGILRTLAAVDQAYVIPPLNMGYPVMLTRRGQDAVVRGATREFAGLVGARCTVAHGIETGRLSPYESLSGVLLSALVFPDRKVQPGSFSFVLPSGRRTSYTFDRLTGNEEWVWANDLELVLEMVELEVQMFPDGCYVAGAKATHAHLLRNRVVSIDGVPVTDLLERMEPLIPAGLAEMIAALYLRSPQVLRGLEVDGAPHAVSYVLLDAAGNKTTLALEAEQPQGPYAYGVAQGKLPIFMSGPAVGYWTRVLTGEPPALYFRLGSCDDDQAAHFTGLATEVRAEYDKKGYDRVILDLRCSTCWSAKAVQPFALELETRAQTGRSVPLYIIADRSTAPAVAEAAAQIRARIGATVIGEAIRYAGTEYSGRGTLCLPNSGLEVTYPLDVVSSREPGVLVPDFEVLVTAAEYFAGDDPLLARAREPR